MVVGDGGWCWWWWVAVDGGRDGWVRGRPVDSVPLGNSPPFLDVIPVRLAVSVYGCSFAVVPVRCRLCSLLLWSFCHASPSRPVLSAYMQLCYLLLHVQEPFPPIRSRPLARSTDILRAVPATLGCFRIFSQNEIPPPPGCRHQPALFPVDLSVYFPHHLSTTGADICIPPPSPSVHDHPPSPSEVLVVVSSLVVFSSLVLVIAAAGRGHRRRARRSRSLWPTASGSRAWTGP